MWYENNEEKKVSPNGTEEASSGKHAGVESAGQAFPGQMDPTRAFEDDEEPAGGPATAGEISSLKSAIKELDDKANANYDRYLRALAELDNFKKRVARERMDQMRYAGEDLLKEILPVADNLERTLSHAHEQSDIGRIVEGVTMIQRQLVKALEKSGVSLIDQAPVPFDPAVHQALERVTDTSHPDDTVLNILQKGYILNGKVIRPAMVRVAKHP